MESIRYDDKGKIIPDIHFGFILNMLKISSEVELPIQLIDNHQIDRATKEQVHIVKQVLWENLSTPKFHAVIFMYENDFYVQNGEAYSINKLDETNWKYFVINNTKTEEGNQKMIDLLRCCFMVGRIRLATQSWGTRAINHINTIEFKDAILHYFDDISRHPVELKPVEIKMHLIEKVREIYTMYKDVSNKKEFEFIKIAMENYRMSDSSNDKARIKTVEYFSILELLLTHDPRDRGDSLTKQLAFKIELLSNRFLVPVSLADFFGSKISCSVSKVCTLLYKLRSSIAHGEEPDFKNELQLLRNIESSNAFLSFLVESVLYQSLKEPQLIKDLKPC